MEKNQKKSNSKDKEEYKVFVEYDCEGYNFQQIMEEILLKKIELK